MLKIIKAFEPPKECVAPLFKPFKALWVFTFCCMLLGF